MPENALLQDTIEVTVSNVTYEFQIPGYLDEIKIGVREKNIRREVESDIGGDVSGAAEGLDNSTYFLIRVAATFEVLLRKSGDKWPWSDGPQGKPIVSFKAWPKDKVGEAISVGIAFQDELARFRGVRPADRIADGEEVVESKPDTQPVALRSDAA